MRDIPSLIARCASSPTEHLGRKSLQLLRAYLFGYELCCESLEIPLPLDPLDPNAFQDWTQRQITMTTEHSSRLNAWSCVSPYSYSELISSDDADSLDTFIYLRAQAVADLSASESLQRPENAPVRRALDDIDRSTDETAFEVIPKMRARPAMYFGNDWSLSDVTSFLSGYRWCERDNGINSSNTQLVMAGFQEWLYSRYPFGRDQPLERILEFLSVSSRERAFDSFVEHLGLYRGGLPSDTTDPTMQKLMSNIVKHATGEADA